MNDQHDDPHLLTLWAAALETGDAEPSMRERLMAALDAEPHLPFCAELSRYFAVPMADMRALLARLVDPRTWTPGVSPVDAFYDFVPGKALLPLHAGFVRFAAGARISRHRHAERELSYVLLGELIDGEGRRYGPGSVLDMPEGSEHSIGVPENGEALVALLHGRIEMLSE